MMDPGCPERGLLVEFAIQRTSEAPRGLLEHLRNCPACREEAAWLRGSMTSLRSRIPADSGVVGPHLGDDDIAALLDGIPDEGRAEWLRHLTACPECRHRVAAVSRLLRETPVASERRRLEAGAPGQIRRVAIRIAGAAAVLVGAFAAGSLLRQGPPATDGASSEQVHRDGIITTTVAPRLVAPSPGATTTDSLRWTAVPHADRYQVLVFDREGTLVWDPQTADTVIAVLPSLAQSPATYVWKVEARTGWDRWVASEWAQFSTTGREESR